MISLAGEIQEARARSVMVNEESLTVDLVDGRTVIVPLGWFPRLWHGSKKERKNLEIFGDGAHVHWPNLDEDITVAGQESRTKTRPAYTALKSNGRGWTVPRRRCRRGAKDHYYNGWPSPAIQDKQHKQHE